MAFGLRPVSNGGYQYNTGGSEAFPISDNANVIGHGDLVSLTNGGGIILQTGTPDHGVLAATSVVPANQILGVFVGCRYTDNNGTPTWSQYYPGNASTNVNEEQIGFVVTGFSAVFEVSSGSGAANAWSDAYIGETYDLANMSSASTTTGNSGITIADLDTVADPAAVRVIGVKKDGNNETSNVTTPIVYVRWSDPTVLHYGYGAGV
tara:strand:+ start:41 stop:661 length:621 start_codon:yes stop_codon:yes gene_type:complete